MAERQGRYLANLLNKGGPGNVEPFKFTSMGMLAYIGGFQGLSDLPDFKLKGMILNEPVFIYILETFRIAKFNI